MPDSASVNRSLSTIRTELEYLRDAGVVQQPQLQSILAQLPHDGKASQYTDPKYSGNQPNFQQIAQDAQNPQNPANPQHPQHHQWAHGMASKLGSAVVFGAGATFGGDMVNDALKKF